MSNDSGQGRANDGYRITLTVRIYNLERIFQSSGMANLFYGVLPLLNWICELNS
jgi:hypothetical protein